MDEYSKSALIIRLKSILSHIQENKLQLAQKETKELIEEITDGIVAPF